MIKLWDSSIVTLLPEFIAKQSEVQALAYAIQVEVQRNIERTQGAMIWTNIDALSGRLLDAAAAQLRVPNYDSTLQEPVKRAMVHGAIPYYIAAGTVGAFTQAVSALFGGCDYEDWYRYSGLPYHFRATVRGYEGEIKPDTLNKLRADLDRVKRLSSKMDSLAVENVRANGVVFIAEETVPEFAYTALPQQEDTSQIWIRGTTSPEMTITELTGGDRECMAS